MHIGKTISIIIGKGSIGHNNREFIAPNVDSSRTSENITLVCENLKDVYHEIFDVALYKYNAKQKRKDRIIKDYYEHIFHSKQEKAFYELVVQIGNKDDTPCGSDDGILAAQILEQFAKDFSIRNPHIRVFNSVIHLDEATPHLHIDFVPFATEQKRGLSTRNSLSKALEQQGFIAKLTLHGKFDFDSISEYNMLKADEMLKNIDKVTNKNDFLKQVFLQCPFNPSVYEKCLDLGLLDVETFKTAEYFNLTNEFSDKIEKQCKGRIDEKENFSSALELYTYYKKLSKKEALAELYNDQISYIKYQYQSISQSLLNDSDLKSWIQPNITTIVTTLCEYDEFKLNQRINDVLSKIISNNQYDMFKINGLLNTFNIPKSHIYKK